MPDAALQPLNGAVQEMNFVRKQSALAILAAFAFAVPVQAADFDLYDGKAVASIVTDGAKNTPLGNAANLLAHDLTSLSGKQPKIASAIAGLTGPAVIVGTADSPMIAGLLKANHIDAAPIAGKWESYGRAVVPAPWNPKQNALVIFGSDTRGAIWGVIDLTREMGVSAWEWWADVTIRKADAIHVSDARFYSREPSVKYRAIFLNDEDFGLKPWASKTYDPKLGDIGPKTYRRIFELMWRLKANTIWPAMHKGTAAFDDVPGNAQTAADYAIVHASSHAEPMLRNNDREWNVGTMGPFSWLSNKHNVLKYWDEAVEAHKQYENVYTVGMRGIGDTGMVGVSSAGQTKDALTDVIAEQRRILERRLGKPADQIPQAFTPYKEVLQAYDVGLKLPDDIMLTWPDDNYGYIRHLPNGAERMRSGGSGIYYHISYWGAPASYLWLATTHPALMWEETNKAYRLDARKIWIVNVGDIKPGEYLTQLFLDMAFDNEAFGAISSVRAHLKHWVTQNFGPEHADEITNAMWRYYDLAFDRRPEFMGWNQTYPTTAVQQSDFNMLAFGDEIERRLDAYRELARQSKTLIGELPKDRRDAFFQIVGYPIGAAAAMNERGLNLDKAIAYGLQRRASANLHAARAKAAQAELYAGENYYNNVMSRGKWRGMMDIAPAKLPVFAEPAFPNWTGKPDTGCAVQTEDGGFYEGGVGARPALPLFYRHVPQTRYLDVFVKSAGAAKWTATPSESWIKVSHTKGAFDPKAKALEQRLQVTIDWATAPDNGAGTIAISCSTSKTALPVSVRIAPHNAADATFLEVDRIVSMFAAHADAMSAGWEVLDGLGHTGASLRSKLDDASSDAVNPATPFAAYRFATTTADDVATLSVFALPILPLTSGNGMRVAVSIDGSAPVTLNLATAEFSQEWRRNVLTNTAVGQVPNLHLAPCVHELKVFALDPGLILDRFEVAFTGAQRAYGPVPETKIMR